MTTIEAAKLCNTLRHRAVSPYQMECLVREERLVIPLDRDGKLDWSEDDVMIALEQLERAALNA